MGYGNYGFPANIGTITTSTVAKYDAAGLPYSLLCRVNVLAAFGAANAYDADNQSNALIAALCLPFQDFVVKLDNGQTSSIRLRNADSFSGVRITKGPDFPEGKGAEYCTYRTFAFTVEAEYPHPALTLLPAAAQQYLQGYGGASGGGTPGPAFAGGGGLGTFSAGTGAGGRPIQGIGFGNPYGGQQGGGGAGPQAPGSGATNAVPSSNVVLTGTLSYGDPGSSLPGGLQPGTFSGLIITNFHETVTTVGGGPEYLYLKAINGAPQRQLLYPVSVSTGTQSGSATGIQDYPSPAPPLWPGLQKPRPGRVTRKNPKRNGLSYEEFTVEWQYDYEGAGPLMGSPNWWPLS